MNPYMYNVTLTHLYEFHIRTVGVDHYEYFDRELNRTDSKSVCCSNQKL